MKSFLSLIMKNLENLADFPVLFGGFSNLDFWKK